MVICERGLIKMVNRGIDLRYYINVYGLMMLDLPRPRRKVSVIVNHDEWLPIIDGDTGKVVMV